MKNNPEEKSSEFAESLQGVLDDTNIFSRSEWAELLSLSEAAISQWLHDKTLPRPEMLRMILRAVLESDNVSVDILDKFWKMANSNAAETTPLSVRSSRSIAEYMVIPLREAFLRAMGVLTPGEQESILLMATSLCHNKLCDRALFQNELASQMNDLFAALAALSVDKRAEMLNAILQMDSKLLDTKREQSAPQVGVDSNSDETQGYDQTYKTFHAPSTRRSHHPDAPHKIVFDYSCQIGTNKLHASLFGRSHDNKGNDSAYGKTPFCDIRATDMPIARLEAKYGPNTPPRNEDKIHIMFDLQGNVRHLNSKGRRILGFRGEPSEGVNLKNILAPNESETFTTLTDPLRTRTLLRKESVFVTRSGCRLPVAIVAILHTTFLGDKLVEAQAWELNKAQQPEHAFGDTGQHRQTAFLLQSVAHDVRNHYFVHQWACEHLREAIKGNNEALSEIDLIEQTATHANKCWTMLMDHEYAARHDLTPTDLNEIVRNARLLSGPHAPFDIQLDRRLWLANMDYLHVSAILFVLIQNALEACLTRKEKVVVATHNCDFRSESTLPLVTVGALSHRPYVVVSVLGVANSGNQKIADELREPRCATLKPRPEVLRLQDTMEKHGGCLHIETAKDRRTIVSLYFPAEGKADEDDSKSAAFVAWASVRDICNKAKHASSIMSHATPNFAGLWQMGPIDPQADWKWGAHIQSGSFSRLSSALRAQALKSDFDTLAYEANAEVGTNEFHYWTSAKRSQLAIVFTDIVDAVAMRDSIGEAAAHEIHRTHFNQSRQLIRQFEGIAFRSVGDGVIAIFKSAHAAMCYSMALHKNPGHDRIKIRAGIHAGCMQMENDSNFTGSVNFTAKLVKVIKGSEIWLSERAKIDIEQLDAKFHDRLDWQLQEDVLVKDFDNIVRLWSLRQSEK